LLLAVMLLLVCGNTSMGGHWSYPGQLRVHLPQAHGVSVAGLSHAQQLALHDSLHEQARGRYLRGPYLQGKRWLRLRR
jgi:hypothetical protein